jgi:hypothetical protein
MCAYYLAVGESAIKGTSRVTDVGAKCIYPTGPDTFERNPSD